MNAPIDPIAVLDSQIAELRASGDTGNVENLVEARYAFSELVKANRALLDSSPAHMTHRNAKEREAYRAICAALARCGSQP
jgi:hypothetical protein